MKPAHALIALTATSWLPPAAAQLSTPPLIVVEDRGGYSALPYYEALNPQADTPPVPRADSRPPRSYSEADMLPVRSPALTPGIVTPRSIQAPGLPPLFLIGDDERSRAWLSKQQSKLRQLSARGLVVQVENAAALQALRSLAPGLELVPVAGDDMAQRLNLSHYPVLITATGIEQ